MRRAAHSLLLLPLLAACATAGPGSSSGEMAMAYSAPESGPLRYEIADTMVIRVDAMGQVLEIPQVASATVAMSFADASNGVRVTAQWEAWESVLSNPMGSPERGTLADVDGPLIFDMDASGNSTVVELPSMRGMSENLLDPESMAHSFLPRLPGRVATPGMTWTDTIAYVSDRAGSFSDISSVVTYVVAGDTTVAGRRHLRVNYTGTDAMEMEGVQSGMAFTQSAEGSSSGWFLWDPAAGVVREIYFDANFEGIMDADGVPVPLPVAMHVTRTARLAPGM